MDVYRLKSYMKNYGDTVESLAEFLGIHKTTLYAKMQNIKQEFTQKEMRVIVHRYDIPNDDVIAIFFR